VTVSERLQELQWALELELGRQHRLKQPRLSEGLGKALARYPGANLRGRVAELRELLGVEDAAALMQSTPVLLVMAQPRDVPARLDAWAAAFGTDRKAVVWLCSRTNSAGKVLQHDARNTRQKVEALCSVMQGPLQLLEVCATCPHVLAVDPAEVLPRAAALGAGLGLDAAGVAELCQRSPNCLMAPSSTVVAAVEAVRDAAEVTREEAVRMCVRCPCVLQRSPANTAAKARALKQLLGLRGGDLGECMVRPQPWQSYCGRGGLHQMLRDCNVQMVWLPAL
jgi:hypothetical protein